MRSDSSGILLDCNFVVLSAVESHEASGEGFRRSLVSYFAHRMDVVVEVEVAIGDEVVAVDNGAAVGAVAEEASPDEERVAIDFAAEEAVADTFAGVEENSVPVAFVLGALLVVLVASVELEPAADQDDPAVELVVVG